MRNENDERPKWDAGGKRGKMSKKIATQSLMFLKELNLVGLVEKHCVAIAKFCLPTLFDKPGMVDKSAGLWNRRDTLWHIL